jgi:hypothetical protein
LIEDRGRGWLKKQAAAQPRFDQDVVGHALESKVRFADDSEVCNRFAHYKRK